MSGFRHRGGLGRVPDWGGALQPQRGHQGEGVLPVGALRPLLTGDHLYSLSWLTTHNISILYVVCGKHAESNGKMIMTLEIHRAIRI